MWNLQWMRYNQVAPFPLLLEVPKTFKLKTVSIKLREFPNISDTITSLDQQTCKQASPNKHISGSCLTIYINGPHLTKYKLSCKSHKENEYTMTPSVLEYSEKTHPNTISRILTALLM